ncbi:hypothetical protein HGM15179_000996 [Zosterops borbonicus]|uniref:Uncharacterized protein n=1 Tax=Zosterops borbonicus TaxID=364589 RepID=A0A8K1LU84_9PASS|nr:hypothetical protein HGM15179_000996 [Zosterops borbonicus]
MPDSSRTHLLLAKADPMSDGGSTSGIMYLRDGRREWCSANYSRRDEDRGEAAVPVQPMDAHDGAEIHLQPMEEPTLEKVDARTKSVAPWETCAGARSWQGPADQLREEPMLEQVSWQDL